jgi:hypothetical protein
MRVKNTSQYPTAQIKQLMKFAAHGIHDSHVEVHVKGSSNGLRGYAYSGVPGIANVYNDVEYLITIRIPPDSNQLPKKALSKVKRIQRLWPNAIPLEDWRDCLLLVAAHEFRHVWQYQRTRRSGQRGKGEYDAEKFAMTRLNEYRRATERDPIPAVKQPNPFSPEIKTSRTSEPIAKAASSLDSQ